MTHMYQHKKVNTLLFIILHCRIISRRILFTLFILKKVNLDKTNHILKESKKDNATALNCIIHLNEYYV